MTPVTRLPSSRRLSTKIVGMLLGFLFFALLAIGATLLLSWQLEGSSAAINEVGGLRMQAYRLKVLLTRVVHEPEVPGMETSARRQMEDIAATFDRLRRGDPQRPLSLPPDEGIREDFEKLARSWENRMSPGALAVLELSGDAQIGELHAYHPLVDSFVQEIDNLVQKIEHDSERRTFWLRSSQLGMMGIALCGTVAIIYLLFLLIVEPVTRLQDGIRRMTEKDFSVRLPVESRDEFGQLTQGFNHMADRLEDLYAGLEERVKVKTAELEAQNRELAMLYDSAAFLQRPHTMDALCEGFLQRLLQYFGADGGSVRLLDERNGNIHMIVQQGMSSELAESERCMKVGECLCGDAVVQKVSVLHDLRYAKPAEERPCRRDGFTTISVFHIHALEQQLGFFNLLFNMPRAFSAREEALLETLGQLLGIAIENRRLAAREREMAISEERNLVAQGLHDSIAQGLTFMNLQLQMLDDSLHAGKLGEVEEIVPALRAGVQESYEDVRELLLNFRSRLAEDDLVGALKTAVEKFRRQTGIDAELAVKGNRMPFAREQQLQLLFIVQEALSNVRKHAEAQRVQVRLDDGPDLRIEIRDDGIGFDAETLMSKRDSHVGIHIMRERAQRIHASFDVTSEPGKGTVVSLQLPQEQRRAA